MKRWLGLVSILAAMTMVVWMSARPPEHERLYEQIEPGMTMDEVDVLLGKQHFTDCGPNLNGGPIIRGFIDGRWHVDILVTLDNDHYVVGKRIEKRFDWTIDW